MRSRDVNKQHSGRKRAEAQSELGKTSETCWMRWQGEAFVAFLLEGTRILDASAIITLGSKVEKLTILQQQRKHSV